MTLRLRQSINDNLAAILSLHDEILGELHRAIPDSELNQTGQAVTASQALRKEQGRRRGQSLDAIAENRDSMPWLHDIPGMASESQVAAEVAKVFIKKVWLPSHRELRTYAERSRCTDSSYIKNMGRNTK